VTEIAQPLAVRRSVALAEAVYAGEIVIEGDLHGVLIPHSEEIRRAHKQALIPVLVDPDAECRHALRPAALVDARMRKVPPESGLELAPLVIGIGPGFEVGANCHAIVESNRGHTLGRVYWQGSAAPDTAVPEAVSNKDVERVLRAPAEGVFESHVNIASRVKAGQLIAAVAGEELHAAFDGVVRGILHDGLTVKSGEKVGDLDPRGDPALCHLISDKSLAVGGGVLEAVLSHLRLLSYLSA
jgi:xanthine dehydrogenase accessory factor